MTSDHKILVRKFEGQRTCEKPRHLRIVLLKLFLVSVSRHQGKEHGKRSFWPLACFPEDGVPFCRKHCVLNFRRVCIVSKSDC
jgi:hypothetical protein